MNSLQTRSLLKIAATLAIAAGILTASFWSAGPISTDVSPGARAAVVIDPAIPAVTIVAKRLTALEKEQMAREDATPVGGAMTTANGAGARRLLDGRAL